MTAWQIYVDGVGMANGTGANVNAALTLPANSQHRITVKGWDASGAIFSSGVVVSVH